MSKSQVAKMQEQARALREMLAEYRDRFTPERTMLMPTERDMRERANKVMNESI